MHPILSKRKSLIIYLAIWLTVSLLIEIPIIYPYKTQWFALLLSDIPLILFFALISLSSYYICRFFPIKTTRLYNVFSVLLTSALIAGGIELAVGYAWIKFIDSLNIAPPIMPLYEIWIAGIYSVLVLIFLLIAAMHYVIISFEQTREIERQTMELRVLAQDAELRALRAQIDPHFLFNSLNSVSALTTANPERARTMVILLAEFFRNSLDMGSKDHITLADELSLINKFLTIEQVRFGSRLNVKQNITQEALKCKIPPLLLQPLIENAVRHGISQLIDGGTISINATISSGRLKITVDNPYDPDYIPKKGTGLGITNVKARIQTLFGNEGRIEVEKKENLFKVELIFPIEKK